MADLFTLFSRTLFVWLLSKELVLSVISTVPRLPSDEERLLELMFDGYNPSARPVLNSSKTVDVRIQFSLMQIQELNLRNQVFTTTGLLILEWFDERLRWNPHQIPLQDIVVEAKMLWRPEFASINGAEGIYGDFGQFRALINSSGLVHWEPGGIFKTVCEIDITYYPFDEQRCRLIFGAWSYHTSKMNLTNMSDVVNLDSYEKNGEWEVYKTVAERGEFYFDCCPNERFANVAFIVFLRRRYTFYIMNVILPSLMTSVLLLSIFFCTPAQKVQIGVVVLLSFRIFLLNVTDSIPKTSDHIPLLGIYLTCTMAITTLSMVLTVFVLNLHHISDRPVPKWARKLVLCYIARLLCMCSYTSLLDEEEADSSSKTDDKKNTYRITPNTLSKAIGGQLGILTNLNGTLGSSTSSSNRSRDDRNVHSTFEKHNPNYKNQYTYGGGGDEPAPPKKEKKDIKRLEELWAREWRRLAEVVDRLFFWMFLSAIVITTLLLFHPLTKSYFSLLGDETILGEKSGDTEPTETAN